MAKYTGSLTRYPARALFLCYVSLITVGTLMLLHPACRRPNAAPISPLQAAFTATSAACVTGLTVRSTAHDFSWAGQAVILALIQVGGIGIMTITTFVTFSLGGQQSLRHKAILAETLGAGTAKDLRWLLRHVIVTVLACEFLGACLLWTRNALEMPASDALWGAAFHSVSAFCNAGFALADDSLTRYQGDGLVCGTIMSLVVVGGLGFPVLFDLRRNWKGPWPRRWERLSLHTKLMLLGTLILLLLGTAGFLLLEWTNTLLEMPLWKKLLAASFHSVSSRTAGFNTVDIGSLSNAMLFVTVLLMAIGAGACSTAGGFKVSTFMVLLLHAWSKFRGSRGVQFSRRTIAAETVDRAIATAFLFGVIAAVGLTLVLVSDSFPVRTRTADRSFLDLLFEVVSALGTVGLSAGATTRLNEGGLLIVIVLMFVGRVGPISAFIVLARSTQKQMVEFPKEEVLLG